MNILFLTISEMEDINQRGIYTDLVRELSQRGINVYVIYPRQKRKGLPTTLSKCGNINILGVRTGNITKTKSLIEKGISTITVEKQYLNALKKYFKDIKFDMVIYSTPPITFNRILKYFKTKQGSKTYLMLKDIFPQNAVDIGIIRKGGLLWRCFRRKEIKLYKNSDIIGCMSKGNMDYILRNNSYIRRENVEIFPNGIKPIDKNDMGRESSSILKKYNIPKDVTLFIYGGNLGKPQGVDFIIEVVNNFHKVDNGYLLIVGDGTEYDKLKEYIESRRPERVNLIKELPTAEYDILVGLADVGLIFLDKRFTIPNFPSRLLSYMENSLPILAATDINTDLKDVLRESGSGFWCESKDIDIFIDYAQKLSEDSGLRNDMGFNGRRYLEENYDITKTIDILLKHLDGDENYV